MSAYKPGPCSKKSEEDWKRVLAVLEDNTMWWFLGTWMKELEKVGRYDVPARKDTGENLIGLCMERKLLDENSWFNKTDVHKHIWENMTHGTVVIWGGDKNKTNRRQKKALKNN